MKSRFDRYGFNLNVEFSSEELESIKKLKIDYINRLYDQFSYDYEMFDIETSTHPTSASKINALEKLKQTILDGKIFDKSYFDILKLNGSTVQFNDQKFIEFALSYSILDHDNEQVAFIVLCEIWQVHLLNLMILEYDKNNLQLSTNYIKINLLFDPIILPNKQSHLFLLETVNRPEFEIKRKWISQLFRFLKGRNNGKNVCYLKGDEFEFADYWNSHNLGYKINKHKKSIGLNGMKGGSIEYESIESWFKEFTTANNNPR